MKVSETLTIAVDRLFNSEMNRVNNLHLVTLQENLTIEELKSRRNIAISLIEEKSIGHPRKTFFTNRKISLLSQVNVPIIPPKLPRKTNSNSTTISRN